MDVAEELTEFEDQIDRAHVERRIEDWRHRIADLYSDVTAWLPSGWWESVDGEVSLHEELMQRFGVAEQRLPILSLKRGSVSMGRLEPRGLWIIGANGRVDLILSLRHFIITDRAENFDAPRWMITDLRDRLSEIPLVCESLRARLS